MWRHAIAIAAAIGLTLVFLEFWGEFGGAMSQAAKISFQSATTAKPTAAAKPMATDKPMPITVIGAGPACTKAGPCPAAPDTGP